MYVSYYNKHQFYKHCLDIAVTMDKDNFWPDYWFGLDRGGLIPATTIRRLLQEVKPDLKSWCRDEFFMLPKNVLVPRYLEETDFTGCKIIIVDDICDSGYQFSNIYPSVYEGAEVKFCSLIYNKTNENNIIVDYYGRLIDKKNNPLDRDWVQFWWEFDTIPSTQKYVPLTVGDDKP